MLFFHAKPIFLKDMHRLQNIQAGFYQHLSLGQVPNKLMLRITGRSYYKLYINGEFAHYGPARAAHDCSRVDQIDVTRFFQTGDNAVAFEVAGYNQGCLSSTGEYSFLQAELFADAESLLHTDSNWLGLQLQARERFVENLSHARNASEIYQVDADFIGWRVQPRKALLNRNYPAVPVEELAQDIRLLERQAAYPDFSCVDACALIRCQGLMPPSEPLRESDPVLPVMKRPGSTISPFVVERPAVECQADRYTALHGTIRQDGSALSVTTRDPAVALDFDFHTTLVGFAGIELICREPAVIDVVFVNKLTPHGGFDPTNTYSRSVARFKTTPGEHVLELFEPYDFRYLRVIVRKASRFLLKRVYARRCQSADLKGGSFLCSDDRLNRIYDAARLALILNSFDVYMDCAGRERGGWSMDAFWTARAARLLFADDGVERDMLDNYLSDTIPAHTDLMPACYPGEDITRIHNWTIFLGIQMADFARRSGDVRFLKERLPQVEWLVGTLSRFENAFGLLENLPELVYVDGTICGRDTHNQPISTGTNAAYAWMLEQLGLVLDYPLWVDKARKILDQLRQLIPTRDEGDAIPMVPDSFSIDAAGQIKPNPAMSEASQYLYLWMGLIEREHLPNYCRKLFAQFGQNPEEILSTWRRLYLGADLPVGTAMRLEALARFGETKKLYNEMTQICGYMFAQGPGTLWEGFDRDGSNVSHGYPAYFAVWLMRDFAGLGVPDELEQRLVIAPHLLDLTWASAQTQTKSGLVSASWTRRRGTFDLTVTVPSGFAVSLELPDEILGWTIMLERESGAEPIDPLCVHLDLVESFVLRASKPKRSSG